MNLNVLLLIAGMQMNVAGNVLKQQDADNIGKDDIIGSLLLTGGQVVIAYANGKPSSVNEKLRLLRDAIDAYLSLQSPLTDTSTAAMNVESISPLRVP